MTKTVLNFSDAFDSKAYNNQSCKHDLKLKGETVTVTGADDHYHGDGRSRSCQKTFETESERNR